MCPKDKLESLMGSHLVWGNPETLHQTGSIGTTCTPGRVGLRSSQLCSNKNPCDATFRAQRCCRKHPGGPRLPFLWEETLARVAADLRVLKHTE